MSRLQKVDFRFRLRTSATTGEGVVLDYIRNGYHPYFPPREMILRAIKAYWLPFAYSERQDLQLSEASLKRLAQEAVSSLEQQIKDIERTFSLERDIGLYRSPSASMPLIPATVQPTVESVPATISNTFDTSALEIESDPF